MPTSMPNFNFLALLVSEIKRWSQNLMRGLLAPCHTPYTESLCVLQVPGKIKQPAKFQHRMHAVMQICMSHRLSIICAQKLFFWGLEGEDVKILCSNLKTTLPCMNTHLLAYHMSKLVQRPSRQVG